MTHRRSPLLALSLMTLGLAAACRTTEVPAAEFSVSDAVYILPASDGPAAIYFTIHNPGPAADTLLSVSAPNLGAISLHETMTMGEGPLAVTHMMQTARVTIPAKSELKFAPGVRHAMAVGTAVPPARGDSITLTFTFAGHAPLTATAHVKTYAEYDPRAPAAAR